jgi:hypothetical protein
MDPDPEPEQDPADQQGTLASTLAYKGGNGSKLAPERGNDLPPVSIANHIGGKKPHLIPHPPRILN